MKVGAPTGLPADPLLDLLQRRAAEAGLTRKVFLLRHFGDHLERNYWRWTAGQGVSRDVADQLCVALGVHPTDLWATWNTTANHPIGGPMGDDDWRAEAACREVDPDLFFPDSPHDLPAEAHLLCLGCPVFDQCFTFGLSQRYGIWAGTTEHERHELRRRRGIRIDEDLEEIA